MLLPPRRHLKSNRKGEVTSIKCRKARERKPTGTPPLPNEGSFLITRVLSTQNTIKMSVLEHFQVAEISISYQPKVKASERAIASTSTDAYKVFLSQWSHLISYIEEFNVLFLNQGNKVIGFFNVSKGGINCTSVDKRVIFAAALKACAVSVILAHNHPSGNLYPSQADIDLTKDLYKAGEILGIKVVDHLVISPDGFYSFADEGLI